MMHTAELLQVYMEHRGDAITIPGRGGRHWVPMSDEPHRDVPLGDPAMGGHSGFGLGLALAQPDRKIVLFDSEGDLLMSLGILTTIAEQNPTNLYHFMLDNEVYATTGGQPVPNAKNVDYAAFAKAAGYPKALAFTEIEDFSRELPGILNEPGPVFVALKVFPEIQNEAIGNRRPWQVRSRTDVVGGLRDSLK
jgi:thiamine pyrophosphate-dependent acetolactate synthase large subunit-like protein